MWGVATVTPHGTLFIERDEKGRQVARSNGKKTGVDLPSYRSTECRVLTQEEPEPGCYILGADCTRCGTEKTVHINKRTGVIVKRRMSYPEGYIIHANPYKPKDFRITYGNTIA